jgi:hypothetical protein
MTFDEGTERERNVQRVSKIEGKDHMLLDVLLASSSLAGALDDRLEVNLPEGPLTIVSRPTLIRMARMAGRKQDLLDLEQLERGDG